MWQLLKQVRLICDEHAEISVACHSTKTVEVMLQLIVESDVRFDNRSTPMLHLIVKPLSSDILF